MKLLLMLGLMALTSTAPEPAAQEQHNFFCGHRMWRHCPPRMFGCVVPRCDWYFRIQDWYCRPVPLDRCGHPRWRGCPPGYEGCVAVRCCNYFRAQFWYYDRVYLQRRYRRW